MDPRLLLCGEDGEPIPPRDVVQSFCSFPLKDWIHSHHNSRDGPGCNSRKRSRTETQSDGDACPLTSGSAHQELPANFERFRYLSVAFGVDFAKRTEELFERSRNIDAESLAALPKTLRQRQLRAIGMLYAQDHQRHVLDCDEAKDDEEGCSASLAALCCSLSLKDDDATNLASHDAAVLSILTAEIECARLVASLLWRGYLQARSSGSVASAAAFLELLSKHWLRSFRTATTRHSDDTPPAVVALADLVVNLGCTSLEQLLVGLSPQKRSDKGNSFPSSPKVHMGSGSLEWHQHAVRCMASRMMMDCEKSLIMKTSSEWISARSASQDAVDERRAESAADLWARIHCGTCFVGMQSLLSDLHVWLCARVAPCSQTAHTAAPDRISERLRRVVNDQLRAFLGNDHAIASFPLAILGDVTDIKDDVAPLQQVASPAGAGAGVTMLPCLKLVENQVNPSRWFTHPLWRWKASSSLSEPPLPHAADSSAEVATSSLCLIHKLLTQRNLNGPSAFHLIITALEKIVDDCIILFGPSHEQTKVASALRTETARRLMSLR